MRASEQTAPAQWADRRTLMGSQYSRAPDLVGTHILIVDDEADSLEILQYALELHGAEVTTAASAAEALEILRFARPELLISDIGLPKMDGYQLMRHIRANERTGVNLKAIALTAFTGQEAQRRAMTAGFHEFISKPFDISQLVSVVDDLLYP